MKSEPNSELKVESSPKMSAEEIKAASDKEKQERSNECSERINAILKDYNCNLTISGFVITAN